MSSCGKCKEDGYWWDKCDECLTKTQKDVKPAIKKFLDDVYYITDSYYGVCVPEIVNEYAVLALRVKELESIVFNGDDDVLF